MLEAGEKIGARVRATLGRKIRVAKAGQRSDVRGAGEIEPCDVIQEGQNSSIPRAFKVLVRPPELHANCGS